MKKEEKELMNSPIEDEKNRPQSGNKVKAEEDSIEPGNKKKNHSVRKDSRKKAEQTKRGYPKWQFIFNLCSLIFGLLIFAILGGRCFYFYSKFNIKETAEFKNLATMIESDNRVVNEGDGFYRGKDGYYFKGKVSNNYVRYANRLFRIIEVNDDNRVTLIADQNQTVMPWGDAVEYQNSNPYVYLNQTETPKTGLFFDTLGNTGYYLDQLEWCQDTLVEGKITCEKEEKTKARLLTLNEYMRAGAENSYLNTGTYTWLMGMDKMGNNIYLDKSGAISSGDYSEGYGIRPVISFKASVEISGGKGTKEDPYFFDNKQDNSVYNRFVALGDHMWRIVSVDENNYHLALNGILPDSARTYSRYQLAFDTGNWYHIARYLNQDLYSSLPYAGVLQDCTFYTGELNDGTTTSYLNLFKNSVVAKVGLLSMTDLNVNEQLNNYFMLDHTKDAGELVMVGTAEGRLMEDLMTATKEVVPVICINKESLTSGDGSSNTPYRME